MYPFFLKKKKIEGEYCAYCRPTSTSWFSCLLEALEVFIKALASFPRHPIEGI